MGRYCRTRGQSRKPSYPFPSYPSYPCYPSYPSFPVLSLSRYRRPDFETGDQSRCRDRDPSCCWCSHCRNREGSPSRFRDGHGSHSEKVYFQGFNPHTLVPLVTEVAKRSQTLHTRHATLDTKSMPKQHKIPPKYHQNTHPASVLCLKICDICTLWMCCS